MKKGLLILVAIVSAQYSVAGISGRGHWTMEKTVGALKLPAFNRKLLFEKIDVKALKNLQVIAFDEAQEMSLRWRALTTLAIYGGSSRTRIVKKAALSPQWYVRNAAIVSANHIDPKLGVQVSRKLINDEAMVVRAAAIETFGKYGEANDIQFLWREFNRPRNFRKGRSLWVRGKIAEALAEHVTQNEMQRVVEWLRDSDQKVQQVGVRTMEKLVGVSLGKSKESNDKRVKRWLAWWGQRASL